MNRMATTAEAFGHLVAGPITTPMAARLGVIPLLNAIFDIEPTASAPTDAGVHHA
jgi:hypothetical protein